MPRATPVRDELTEPFWAAASRRSLVAQRCAACDRWQHPPRPACAWCGADDVAFTEVSGVGTVLTWTQVHQPFVRSWREDLPFTCFLVSTPEDLVFASDDVHFFRRRGARLHPYTGMPVRVDFEPLDGGLLLPQFVPVEG